MTQVPLNLSAGVTLDGTGAGTVRLGPGIGQKWVVMTAAVSTATSTKIPQCSIYIGGHAGPDTLVDGTFTGNLDSTSRTSGYVIGTGEFIWAVWSGGDVGTSATLSIIGMMQYGS